MAPDSARPCRSGRAPEKPFAATELRRASLRVNVYQAVRSDAFALTYDEYWTGFEALFAQTDVIAIGEPLVPQHSDYDSLAGCLRVAVGLG